MTKKEEKELEHFDKQLEEAVEFVKTLLLLFKDEEER